MYLHVAGRISMAPFTSVTCNSQHMIGQMKKAMDKIIFLVMISLVKIQYFCFYPFNLTTGWVEVKRKPGAVKIKVCEN